MSVTAIRKAQTELNDEVLGKPGVEGTAIGQVDGAACLKVYVSDPKAKSDVPSKVAGFRVVVERSGTFRRL